MELTDHDALAAHLSTELNIDENDVVSPWRAASPRRPAFVIGAVLPLLAILLPPDAWRVPVTVVARAARAGRSPAGLARASAAGPRCAPAARW